MYNITNIEIKYEYIRKPKFKTNNIFEYAAKFKSILNQECYLIIKEFESNDGSFHKQVKKLIK